MPKVDFLYMEERKNYIIECTKEVLSEKSMEQVNMRDVIKKTGFSQGTIYNYYKNIQEIFSVMICRYMHEMKEALEAIADRTLAFDECYREICQCLIGLYERNPQLFKAVLGKVSYHDVREEKQDVLYEIYQVGEELNDIIIVLLKRGMEDGFIRYDLNLYVTVFHLWSSIGQTILFAYDKQIYIEKQFHMSRQEYMEQGFALILHSVLK